MSVDIEPTTVVDRSPSARVAALHPRVGRHAAGGPSPEVAELIGDAGVVSLPTAARRGHLPRHPAGGEADGRPLGRELEGPGAQPSQHGPDAGGRAGPPPPPPARAAPRGP